MLQEGGTEPAVASGVNLGSRVWEIVIRYRKTFALTSNSVTYYITENAVFSPRRREGCGEGGYENSNFVNRVEPPLFFTSIDSKWRCSKSILKFSTQTLHIR